MQPWHKSEPKLSKGFYEISKVYVFWESHKILWNLQLDLSYVVPVKSTVEILQNFVAFSEYTNFI